MALCTFWALHHMCRYVEVQCVTWDKGSWFLTLGSVPGPNFRIGVVRRSLLSKYYSVMKMEKTNIPPPYCCICTKLHGLIIQKMATVKCNFIYSRISAYITHTYIDDTVTVWRYKILYTMKLLTYPIAFLTTFDALWSLFFTGVGVDYTSNWVRYVNSSVNISYLTMAPYWQWNSL